MILPSLGGPSAKLTSRKLCRLVAEAAVVAVLASDIRASPRASFVDLLFVTDCRSWSERRVPSTRPIAQAESVLHDRLVRSLCLSKHKLWRAAVRHAFLALFERASVVRGAAGAERYLSFGAFPGAFVKAVTVGTAPARTSAVEIVPDGLASRCRGAIVDDCAALRETDGGQLVNGRLGAFETDAVAVFEKVRGSDLSEAAVEKGG